MTQLETVQVLALLNAYYAGGKNDPKSQVKAWHMILGKYDYETAVQAILDFAENDTRDYATFPAVGLIVKAIKTEETRRKKPVNEILYGVSTGRDYNMISDNAKKLISADMYNEWLKMDAEKFNNRMGEFEMLLQSRIKRIGVTA